MSVKLKKTEQRHCPPDPRAKLLVSLVIIISVFVGCVDRVGVFVGFIVVRNLNVAHAQMHSLSVGRSKHKLKTLPT